MSGFVYCFMLAVIFNHCSSVWSHPNSVQDEILERLESLQAEVQHLKTSEAKIVELESKVQILESEVQNTRHENKVLQEKLSNIKSLNPINLKKDNGKKKTTRGKRLIGSDIIPQFVPSATAFSAVITPQFDRHIGTFHVFVYDHVVCNLGGAYNNITGIFTAPTSGVFAFLWTVVAEGSNNGDSNYGEIATELLVNSQPRGRVDTDTEVNNDDDQATGFVIVQLTQGDLVYIRSSTKNAVQGVFQKNLQGGWTFSGWQIA